MILYHLLLILQVWQAEERTKDEQQKQDDLRAEYEREQEIYDNRYVGVINRPMKQATKYICLSGPYSNQLMMLGYSF